MVCTSLEAKGPKGHERSTRSPSVGAFGHVGKPTPLETGQAARLGEFDSLCVSLQVPDLIDQLSGVRTRCSAQLPRSGLRPLALSSFRFPELPANWIDIES